MSDTITLGIKCPLCNNVFEVTVLSIPFFEFYKLNEADEKPDPEEFFPYLSNEEKALLRGSVCFTCLKSITGGIL